MKQRKTSRQIYLWPATISLVVGSGLISALLGDGVWDEASWGAMLVPVAVLVVAWWKPRRSLGDLHQRRRGFSR